MRRGSVWRSAFALLLGVSLGGCSGSGAPPRPDFLTAPTQHQRVTSIQFLSDEEVLHRLDDLEEVGRTSDEARVRDQVVRRLLAWGEEPALPILLSIYVEDPDTRVSRAALRAIRDLCWQRHGPLRASGPPSPAPSESCLPAYDGTWSLPLHRPPPRATAAAFWRAEGVTTKQLPTGEIWPAEDRSRQRVFARYPAPPGWTGNSPF